MNDDATIWINGTLIYTDLNGESSNAFDLDIKPYLVVGNNLIAVHASRQLAGPRI